jgi:hypothetical protein
MNKTKTAVELANLQKFLVLINYAILTEFIYGSFTNDGNSSDNREGVASWTSIRSCTLEGNLCKSHKLIK